MWALQWAYPLLQSGFRGSDVIAGGANVASGGIGKGADARTGAGETGAAAQVMLLFSSRPWCVYFRFVLILCTGKAPCLSYV